MDAQRVGDFTLVRPIGRGGMARVWEGAHPTGAHVAVKVLTAEFARREDEKALFRREVRAAARLDHPNVVQLFDYGDIEHDVPAAGLVAGSPYLVMELVPGAGGAATLRPLVGACSPWSRVEGLLLQLLAALGHAHARGVVHLDVKAENVLLVRGRDVRLTDFGIAQVIRQDRATGPVGLGTPAYMAPEQIRGTPWRFGPWTDLYAVGCLAFELLTGQVPFTGPPLAMAIAHVNQPPPTLCEIADVPSGLAAWVARLLEKVPEDRYQSATVAAAELRALGGRPRPVLSGWRHDEKERPPAVGPGLGLYHLRPTRLVGQERVREQLWAALRQVCESGQAGAVVLAGPAGTGKSRLARWLAERAHEVLGVPSLQALHGALGQGEGLVAVLRRSLCEGAPAHGVRARIEAALGAAGEHDEQEVSALCDLLAPGGARLPRQPCERHALVARQLGRLAERTPLIVVLDDVHWADDTLAFAQHYLASRPAHAVLLVLTLRADLLAERPDAQALLAGLPAPRIEVGPLSETDQRTLIESLLSLEPGLSARITAASEGNPRFAVEAVRGLVEQGMLAPGAGGLQLAPGSSNASFELPESLGQLHRLRAERLLTDLGGEGVALEIAALLGSPVLTAEWLDACRRVGVQPEPRLLEGLFRRRLVLPVGIGAWRLADPGLGDAFVWHAERADLAPALHRACAAMLLERHSARLDPARQLRVGEHLASSGDLAALGHLRSAAAAWIDAGDRWHGGAAIASWRRALDRLALPPGHVERVRLSIEDLELRQFEVDTEFVAQASRAVELARAGGWPALEAQARLFVATGHLHAGRSEVALETMRRAERCVGRIQNPAMRSQREYQRLHGLASAARLVGQHLLAEEALERAMALDLREDQRGRLHLVAARVARARGHLAEARALTLEARTSLRAGGRLQAAARCEVVLGDLSRAEGDLEAAAAAYREGAREAERLGSPTSVEAYLNLCLVELERADFAALSAAVAHLRQSRSRGLVYVRVPVALFTLVLSARAGDWARFDTALEAVGLDLDQTRWIDPDLALAAECAAEQARLAGEPGRAERVAEVARRQRAALALGGDTEPMGYPIVRAAEEI